MPFGHRVPELCRLSNPDATRPSKSFSDCGFLDRRVSGRSGAVAQTVSASLTRTFFVCPFCGVRHLSVEPLQSHLLTYEVRSVARSSRIG